MMQPTCRLRFVRRGVVHDDKDPDRVIMREVRILQQFWACGLHGPIPENPVWETINGVSTMGEWRDVEEVSDDAT